MLLIAGTRFNNDGCMFLLAGTSDQTVSLYYQVGRAGSMGNVQDECSEKAHMKGSLIIRFLSRVITLVSYY
jgi:hypothetical protein